MSKAPGFLIYHSDLEALAELSDEALGRVVRALCVFSQDGTPPQLQRLEERLAFRVLSEKVRRDHDRHNARCEQNARNRAKANTRATIVVDDGQRPSTMVDDGQRPSTMVDDGAETVTKTKTETETKTETVAVNVTQNVTNIADDGDGVNSDLQQIAEAHAHVFDAAQRAGFPSSAADLDKLNGFIADYGAAWTLEAINRATDAPAYARSWRYLTAILKSWRDAGGIDDAERPKRPDHDKPETGNIFARLYREEYGG